MTQEEFHKLVHHVIDRQTPPPPETLFAGGMDNWHARARLSQCLNQSTVMKQLSFSAP